MTSNVYESQQNLGQGLGAGKACLGSKCFVADCSYMMFLLWFIFTGYAFLLVLDSYSLLSACDLLNIILVSVFLSLMTSLDRNASSLESWVSK